MIYWWDTTTREHTVKLLKTREEPTPPPTAEDIARAVRRLEHWHRTWEINNRERIVAPTFASEDDVTHEHRWTFNTYSISKSGRMFDECDVCRVSRLHVTGTPSASDRLAESLYELKKAGS